MFPMRGRINSGCDRDGLSLPVLRWDNAMARMCKVWSSHDIPTFADGGGRYAMEVQFVRQ